MVIATKLSETWKKPLKTLAGMEKLEEDWNGLQFIVVIENSVT